MGDCVVSQKFGHKGELALKRKLDELRLFSFPKAQRYVEMLFLPVAGYCKFIYVQFRQEALRHFCARPPSRRQSCVRSLPS